jgi:hypothetical protein
MIERVRLVCSLTFALTILCTLLLYLFAPKSLLLDTNTKNYSLSSTSAKTPLLPQRPITTTTTHPMLSSFVRTHRTALLLGVAVLAVLLLITVAVLITWRVARTTADSGVVGETVEDNKSESVATTASSEWPWWATLITVLVSVIVLSLFIFAIYRMHRYRENYVDLGGVTEEDLLNGEDPTDDVILCEDDMEPCNVEPQAAVTNLLIPEKT